MLKNCNLSFKFAHKPTSPKEKTIFHRVAKKFFSVPSFAFQKILCNFYFCKYLSYQQQQTQKHKKIMPFHMRVLRIQLKYENSQNSRISHSKQATKQFQYCRQLWKMKKILLRQTHVRHNCGMPNALTQINKLQCIQK